MLAPSWKDFLPLFSLLIPPFFFGEESVRLYAKYYHVEYGGLPAFLLGFTLAYFLLFGFTYGIMHGHWHRNYIHISFFSLVLLVAVRLLFAQDGYVIPMLGVVGYAAGFGLQKLLIILSVPQIVRSSRLNSSRR